MRNLDKPNNENMRNKIQKALNSQNEKEIENALTEIAEEIRKDIKAEHHQEQGEKVIQIRMLENAILPGEKIRSSQRNKYDLGKIVRGMSGLGWDGANEEREYYRSMETGNNKVLIPSEISDTIIDIARSESAILGNVPVIPMDHNNIKILSQTKDPEANFVNEGDLIPVSEAIFEGINLEGKTIAMFIPVSLQLLESCDNISTQLELSTAKAIATALDKAMLYGVPDNDGVKGIKGLEHYDSIARVNHSVANYDLLLKGVKQVLTNNYKPSNIALNTNLLTDLEMLKDTTGQYITMPKSLEKYNINSSNNIKDNSSIIFDSNSLIMGVNKSITMEWGTTSDMFQRMQVGLRIYIRADLGVITPGGIAIANVQTTEVVKNKK